VTFSGVKTGSGGRRGFSSSIPRARVGGEAVSGVSLNAKMGFWHRIFPWALGVGVGQTVSRESN